MVSLTVAQSIVTSLLKKLFYDDHSAQLPSVSLALVTIINSFLSQFRKRVSHLICAYQAFSIRFTPWIPISIFSSLFPIDSTYANSFPGYPDACLTFILLNQPTQHDIGVGREYIKLHKHSQLISDNNVNFFIEKNVSTKHYI